MARSACLSDRGVYAFYPMVKVREETVDLFFGRNVILLGLHGVRGRMSVGRGRRKPFRNGRPFLF